MTDPRQENKAPTLTSPHDRQTTDGDTPPPGPAHRLATPVEPHATPGKPVLDTGPDFSDAHVQAALAYARSWVTAWVRAEAPAKNLLPPPIADTPAYGLFITLRRQTTLRACRGRWGQPLNSLGHLITTVARDAALNDGRFPTITPWELGLLGMELSWMFDPVLVSAAGEDRIDAVRVAEHGLVITHPHGSGLLLPQVATEAGWDAKTFLDQASLKAGLPADTWRRDPRSQLMTFRARIWTSDAPHRELDIHQINAQRLHDLIDTANRWLHDQSIGDRSDPVLTQRHTEDLGLRLETASGQVAESFGPSRSLLELTHQAVSDFKSNRLIDHSKPSDLFRRLTLLWQPLPLRPQDHPDRLGYLPRCGVLIRHDGRRHLVLPPQPHEPHSADPVGSAMAVTGTTPRQWEILDRQGAMKVCAFKLLTFEARQKQANPHTVRQPARAGQFYPAQPDRMVEAVRAHLAPAPGSGGGGSGGSGGGGCRAVMLPHAGWRFCGDVIGKTLARVRVPRTVIVIGPRHTPYGAQLSVAPHQQWDIPGGSVPIDTERVRRLVELAPEVQCEPDAHRMEHGCEVLLPFLQTLQPDLRVVPVVMGQASYETTTHVAQALATMILESTTDTPDDDTPAGPLLVISSDMNHFAPEPENRRLDHMALGAMLTGDPRILYETCWQHQISMCGLLPAVTVMQALAQSAPLGLELVDYDNSATASGDTSSVVGYAGVVLR